MLAEQYITTVATDLKAVTGQIDTVKEAAGRIVDTVSGGRNVFVIDQYHILDAELVNRAGGLALFRSLRSELAVPGAGDLYVVSAFHANHPVDMGYITEAREIGASVLVIAPPGPLADAADIALLNTYDPRNGVLDVQGIGEPFCPVSGIINTTLAWMLTAEVCERLLAADKTPSVFMNEALKGSRETNADARRAFAEKGY